MKNEMKKGKHWNTLSYHWFDFERRKKKDEKRRREGEKKEEEEKKRRKKKKWRGVSGQRAEESFQ